MKGRRLFAQDLTPNQARSCTVCPSQVLLDRLTRVGAELFLSSSLPSSGCQTALRPDKPGGAEAERVRKSLRFLVAKQRSARTSPMALSFASSSDQALYPEGVASHSPGSRGFASAPWEALMGSLLSTPKGLYPAT